MYSAYKLNKKGDNVQHWRTPFPIWNQPVVPCPVLTVASWPAYRFLKRQVRWSDIPISFRIFHSLLWSTQSKALAWSIKQKRLIFSSVQFSRLVISDSLRPHEPQHTRPPCPSPTPSVHPNPCPSSQWCHPTISSSVVPFSSCPQLFPASGSFQMSQLFTSGGQSSGVSALASVLPMNTQDWSPLGWTGWISLQSKGLSRVFSNTTIQKHQFFDTQLSSDPKIQCS